MTINNLNLKTEYFSIFITLSILVSSCSSTKLLDSWKSQNFDSLSNSKILVISKTPENDVRKSYESAIANKLRTKNIDAIESHIHYPSLREASTPEAQNLVVKQFKKDGITAIILTSLKQTIETPNGSKVSQEDIPKDYEDKRSFDPNKVNKENGTVSTSKTYILEGLIYNLTLDRGEQLVNVCLVNVTDPDSPEKIRKSFTKIISDQFR